MEVTDPMGEGGVVPAKPIGAGGVTPPHIHAGEFDGQPARQGFDRTTRGISIDPGNLHINPDSFILFTCQCQVFYILEAVWLA